MSIVISRGSLPGSVRRSGRLRRHVHEDVVQHTGDIQLSLYGGERRYPVCVGQGLNTLNIVILSCLKNHWLFDFAFWISYCAGVANSMLSSNYVDETVLIKPKLLVCICKPNTCLFPKTHGAIDPLFYSSDPWYNENLIFVYIINKIYAISV